MYQICTIKNKIGVFTSAGGKYGAAEETVHHVDPRIELGEAWKIGRFAQLPDRGPILGSFPNIAN
ncbi:hypothetical protein L0156_27025 [bacterium]|nr:hypothetical protein [bacterium]